MLLKSAENIYDLFHQIKYRIVKTLKEILYFLVIFEEHLFTFRQYFTNWIRMDSDHCGKSAIFTSVLLSEHRTKVVFLSTSDILGVEPRHDKRNIICYAYFLLTPTSNPIKEKL